MQVSPFTIAFSMMSQILLRWCASIGCCLPKKFVIGRLLLAASRFSWCMHMAPTWCSNWLITSFVVIASPERKKINDHTSLYEHRGAYIKFTFIFKICYETIISITEILQHFRAIVCIKGKRFLFKFLKVLKAEVRKPTNMHKKSFFLIFNNDQVIL